MYSLKIPYVSRRTVKNHPLVIGDMKLFFLCSDSIGAKSSSIFIKTPDTSILIDPGVAAMQPGYPLPDILKKKLADYSRKTILKYARKAKIIIITHYHYDHFIDPIIAPGLYLGKNIYIKNPNIFINKSQWYRARNFFTELLKVANKKHSLHTILKNSSTGLSINDFFTKPSNFHLENPMDSLPIAKNKDFGNYQKRRIELLKKGEKWFKKVSTQLWFKYQWIKELDIPNVSVTFAEGKNIKIGNTNLQFSKPLFHGIEFDRIGWVFGVTISHKGKKLLYTSDIQGPFIEDYAKWIIDENPDLLIIDGPPTYLYGYLINKTNLNRAKENINWIVDSVKTKLIVYDHHLTRDNNYKKLLLEVYKNDPMHKLTTTAELFGLSPLILKLN